MMMILLGVAVGVVVVVVVTAGGNDNTLRSNVIVALFGLFEITMENTPESSSNDDDEY
jgi:ABC-type antimicrobial peptide transport system permease subunit